MSTERDISRPRKGQEPEVVTEEVVLVVVYGPPRCGKTILIKLMRENDEANGQSPAKVYEGAEAIRHVESALRRGYSVYWELQAIRPVLRPAIQELVDVIHFFGPKRIAEELDR